MSINRPMIVNRRNLLGGAAGLALAPFVARKALAQAYPSGPVRLFVGFAAGGSTDTVGRLVAQALSERLGQSVVVENRPGAGTNIATAAVIKSPPDGQTLLMVGPSAAINATLYSNSGFVFLRDTSPVASLMQQPQVLLVNPGVAAKSLVELIAYAKANPGKLSFASAGVGSIGHLSGELFKMMVGVDLLHVPYRGAAPALTDLLGGQVQGSFAGLAGAIEFVRAGSLRALAVSTRERASALPDLPSVGEIVAGYESSDWFGVAAPKGTPRTILERLNTELNQIIAQRDMQARFAELGGAALPMTREGFASLVANDTAKWANVIHTANIRQE